MLEKENFEIKGMEHLQGWNITDEDMRKIFLAAENGDADAQNEVGYIFYYGIKRPQSFENAAQWYKKAAVHGHEQGQRNLGLLYYFGKGIEQNIQEALFWLKEAAAQGCDYAQYNVGCIYYIKKDYKEASKWYRKSMKQGNESASVALGHCYRKRIIGFFKKYLGFSSN